LEGIADVQMRIESEFDKLVSGRTHARKHSERNIVYILFSALHREKRKLWFILQILV